MATPQINRVRDLAPFLQGLPGDLEQAVRKAIAERPDRTDEILQAVAGATGGGGGPRPLENTGRYWRGEGRPAAPEAMHEKAWDFLVQTPLGGRVRAIAENLGMEAPAAQMLERGLAGTVYGIGLPAAVAAAHDLIADGQTPDTLPMGSNIVTYTG